MTRFLALRALLWLRRQLDWWGSYPIVDAEDVRDYYAAMAHFVPSLKESMRERHEWNWRDWHGVVHAVYVAPNTFWVNTGKLGCGDSAVAVYPSRCTKDSVTCLLCLAELE